MKKIAKHILFAALAIALLIPAVGLLLPRNFNVPREIVIQAPPEEIFSYINNPSNRKYWSPFQGPSVGNRFEGPKAGVGAIMHWASPGGSGRIEITESQPTSSVEYNTYFDNGYPMSTSRFDFEPNADGSTKVTWGFWGKVPANPLKRYYRFKIDKKTGGKHYDGLVKLKRVVETDNRDTSNYSNR